jgi:hypothetical protein
VEGTETELVAARWPLALWARPAALGLLLLALAGLAVRDGWGWRSEEWTPVPGAVRAVGHSTPYAVRVDRSDLHWRDDGQLRDYEGQITWLADGAAIGQTPLRIGRPARLRGIAVRAVGYSPAVTIRGQDEAGRPLALEGEGPGASRAGEIEIVFATPEAQPLVFVPLQDLFLALSFDPVCAEGRPALRIAAFRGEGGDRRAAETLFESGEIAFDGLRLEVDLAYRPILRLDRQPGQGLLVGATGLALIALAAGWLAAPHVAWIAVEEGSESEALVRVGAPGATGDEVGARRLVEALAEVLDHGQ